MIQSNIIGQKLLGPALYTPKELIKYVGRTPAALLQQLHYSLQQSKFSQYGERWVCRSLEDWAAILECSAKTIQRAFERLESVGLVISDRFHRHLYLQRKSYRVDYARLSDYLSDETKRPDLLRQDDLIDVDILSSSNNRTLNTESNKQQTERVKRTKVQSELIPSHHPVLRVDKEENLVNPATDCKGRDENSGESCSQVNEVKTIEPELEQEVIQTVGHNISLNLKLLIANATESVVRDALTILKTGKNIKNKAGLLRRAIENKWKPSAATIEKKFKLDPDFEEWWGHAKRLGLVLGSEVKDNQLWIYDAQAQAISYQQMLQLHPLESLRLDKPLVSKGIGLISSSMLLAKSSEPVDLSGVLAQINVHFARLGWMATQIQQFLQQTYCKTSMALLDDEQLFDLQARLNALQ